MGNLNVEIDGKRYAPVDEEEAAALGDLIRRFTLEGETYWRNQFVERDAAPSSARYGMYAEGDEKAPFFTEAFLYNLLGKDDARTVLSIIRRLSLLAGVEYR